MVNANEQVSRLSTITFDPNEIGQLESSDEDVTLRDRAGREYVAKVTCGTFSSLAVKVDHGSFIPGDGIEADYGGATIPAVVRRVYEHPDGSRVVVLRWGR